MQLKEFVVSAREVLSGLYAPGEAGAMVDRLCSECFGVSSYAHIITPELELKPASLSRADELLGRLAGGEPLQYVLGYADFYGHRFKVNPSVLIPRPETEILCRDAIGQALIEYRNRCAYGKNARRLRILDLCTGSGCIAWAFAFEVPTAEITGVDISEEAIAVASSQPFPNVPAPRFVCADIFDDKAIGSIAGQDAFDIIVSNPPYVLESEKAEMRRNVLDFEPSSALFVPDADSMAFNVRIAEICKKYLYTDAIGYVEINEKLGLAAKGIFESNGLKQATLIKDLSGRDRFVKFVK